MTTPFSFLGRQHTPTGRSAAIAAWLGLWLTLSLLSAFLLPLQSCAAAALVRRAESGRGASDILIPELIVQMALIDMVYTVEVLLLSSRGAADRDERFSHARVRDWLADGQRGLRLYGRGWSVGELPDGQNGPRKSRGI